MAVATFISSICKQIDVQVTPKKYPMAKPNQDDDHHCKSIVLQWANFHPRLRLKMASSKQRRDSSQVLAARSPQGRCGRSDRVAATLKRSTG